MNKLKAEISVPIINKKGEQNIEVCTLTLGFYESLERAEEQYDQAHKHGDDLLEEVVKAVSQAYRTEAKSELFIKKDDG